MPIKKRILILQTAFTGDVILSTPLAEAIHASDSYIQIDYLVRKGNEGLFKNHPFIGEIYIWDKSKNKYKNLFQFLYKIRQNKYDVIFNCQRFAASGFLTVFSGAKIKIGFDKNPFSIFFTNRFPHEIGDGTHEVERNLSLIHDLGAAKRVRPSLFPTPEDFSVVKSYQEDAYAIVAPASVWFTKHLPKEQWIKLINNLNSKVYLIGAPADEQLCNEIIEHLPKSDVVNLAGKLTLMQSAALISDAQRTYVNDSGPLHIASAMNASVTAFFCSTVPEFGFGPLSDDAKIIQIQEKLECRPCGLHGHPVCPKGHFKCGNEISVYP
jgi:heptosyltransferase-2